MAFGSFGGSGDNIELKVTLDTAPAEREAAKLKTDVENAFKRIQGAASSPISSIKDLASEFGKTSPVVGALGASFAALATKATLVTAAVGAVAIGLNQLVKIAGDGDKFLDIADGFQENADKAGLFADVLQEQLSAAFNDQLDKTQLLIQANKLFAAGADPAVFADLAAAAKAFSERMGIDAVQALDQLTQGIKTGRESMLKGFGTISDGVLILDKFTQSQYASAQASRGVTDTFEFLSAKLSDLYTDFAVAVEQSSTLKLTIEALGGAFLALATVIGEGAQLAIGFLDFFADKINSFINTTVTGFTIMGSVISDIASGQFPDMAKASAKAAEKLGTLSNAGKGASKVSIKLGKDLEGVGKGAKKAADESKKAAQELANIGRETTDSIEKALGFSTPLEDKITTEISKALIAASGDQGKLATALDQINKTIIGNILDPSKAKEAADFFMKTLNKELDKPILGPGNDEGAKEAQLAKFNQKSPTFFGFEFEGSAFEQSLASGIENAVLSGLQIAADAITSGNDISVRQLSSAVGGAIGAAIGSYAGPAGAQAGAIIGTIFGDFIGKEIEKLNGDTSGTEARKSVDKFFADVFSADRLTVIVGNELDRIQDFVINKIPSGQTDGYAAEGAAIAGSFSYGTLAPVGAAIGGLFGGKGPDSFATGEFDDALAAQQANVQSFFAAVGTSFEQLLGVSEEISGQVGAILFNNIGGNLVNLQAVIQSTGKTFEELGDAMFQAFFNGQIGLQQLQDGLVKLNELFSVGIPGEIGAIDVAVQNLQISLQDDKGSRIIFNSLRSIGQEAIEAGKNLGQAAQSIAAGLGVGADKVTLFLQAMKLAGINSVKELVEASNAQLAALGANILQVTQGGTPTNSAVAVPTTSITSAPNFTPVSAASGAARASSSASNSAKRAEEERKRRLEQLRNETERLLFASDKYKTLIEKLNKGTIDSVKGGNQLRELYDGQFKVLQKLQKAQEAYNKALESGVKGKNLAALAKDLKSAEDAAAKFGKSLNNATKPDLTEIVKLINNVNILGEVLNAVGVDADALKEVIVQGFKAGKLSIEEANNKLKETSELLGDGIPGKVGAVADAFSNLVKAGQKGGIFSINAFKDIFAEAVEGFEALIGPQRAGQLRQLRQNVDDANAALQAGITGGNTPEEVDKLRKRLEGAVKALSDFQAVIPKPELEDLRAELKKTFDPNDVDKFFSGLSSSGITSIEEFQKASDDTIIKILGDLKSLGFGFANETDENTKKLLDAFNAQNVALNGGKDLLAGQLGLVNTILKAAGHLSPRFTAAGAAVTDNFEAPLATIATDIADVIQKLAQFEQGTYQADVLLNIRTNAADSKVQSLLELLFDDGSGSTIIGDTPGTGSGLTSVERKEFEALRRKKKSGKKLTAADSRRLAELTAKRGK